MNKVEVIDYKWYDIALDKYIVNEVTGIAYYSDKCWVKSNVGKVAGRILNRVSAVWIISITSNGKKKELLLHRLIFYKAHGYLPNYTENRIVDHIDGNSLNNRIDNLRDITMGNNKINSKLAINNTSGYTGVTWNKVQQQWLIQVNIGGIRKNGGWFDNKDHAILNCHHARMTHYGEKNLPQHEHDTIAELLKEMSTLVSTEDEPTNTQLELF